MHTIADEATLRSLQERLGRLTPESSRRWGTLTAGEMVCHLGDTHESVLGVRIPPGPAPSGEPRRFIKWLVLYSPMPWPKGTKTRPGVNPRIDGTRPGEFERDRARAVETLGRIAVAAPASLPKVHFIFGPMEPGDWHRWAYRHVSHHLRQFGL
jgi:hypothetical protein